MLFTNNEGAQMTGGLHTGNAESIIWHGVIRTSKDFSCWSLAPVLEQAATTTLVIDKGAISRQEHCNNICSQGIGAWQTSMSHIYTLYACPSTNLPV